MSAGMVPGDETPGVADLQGREPVVPELPVVVPVDVVGPVRVQQLPARSFAIRSLSLANAGQPQPLIGEDLLRSRVTVCWSGGDIVIAPTFEEAGADSGRAAVANSPLVFMHTEKMWVRAPAADVLVTAFIEQWTM